jgi:predicted nucleic acid-binding Zn ribbon protein
VTRKREAKRAGDVLSRIIERLKLGTGLAGWQAVNAWDEVAGPEHAGHAKAIRYSAGRLVVEVDSSARMAGLGMEKPVLLERISERVGPGVVRDLMFVMAGRSPKEEGS